MFDGFLSILDGPHLAEVTDRIVLTKDNSDRISGRFQVRNVASSSEALLFKVCFPYQSVFSSFQLVLQFFGNLIALMKLSYLHAQIKTTAPEKFHVRPTIGFLDTSASASITVSVNPGTNIRSLAHERFQVQILIAPKELIDGLNGNHQDMNAAELHGDLSRVWKASFISHFVTNFSRKLLTLLVLLFRKLPRMKCVLKITE